jgi:branched chain amino acid efflux pump
VRLWATVLAASAVCFLLKLAGYLAPHEWLDRPRVARIAAMVTVSLLSALVAVQTFGRGQGLTVDARVPALAAATVALLLRAPFIVVVAVAALVAAAIRAAGWG